jgi:hypothetical protein
MLPTFFSLAELPNRRLGILARRPHRVRGCSRRDFEEARVSRGFFDAADTDHDGMLSPHEIVDALQFEAVDTEGKGYLVLEDLRRFMNRIGR